MFGTGKGWGREDERQGRGVKGEGRGGDGKKEKELVRLFRGGRFLTLSGGWTPLALTSRTERQTELN